MSGRGEPPKPDDATRMMPERRGSVEPADDLGTVFLEPAARPERSAPPGEKGYLFSPGEVLAGRFRIVRHLGRGGMGEVYEAEDSELKDRVALKTVLPEIARDPTTLARFRREIHLARKVTHPNVCRLFDLFHHTDTSGGAGEGRDVTFLTMELLAGEPLSDWIARIGRFPVEDALPLVEQMASALEAAHGQKIVHRDFKPANVVLVPGDSGHARAVVTDFGLARSSSLTAAMPLTVAGDVLGSPAYMAPEQVRGDEVTPASDVYAFGVVLYQMVTGRLPFEDASPVMAAFRRLKEPPPPPSSHLADLDPRWEKVILRCLELDPKDRYPSPSAAVRALAPKRRAGRGPLLAAVLGAAAALAAAAGLWLWSTGSGTPEIAGDRAAVAVLGFANLSGESDLAWLGNALPVLFTTELAAGDELRLISGETVTRARSGVAVEGGVSLAGDTLAKLRRLLGADFVLLGSFLPQGEAGQLRLDLVLQNANDGQATSFSERGDRANVAELVARAAEALRASLGIEALSEAERGNVEAALPATSEATRLYAEGLSKLRLLETREARELLEQAAAADPGNPSIRAFLAEAWAQLGYDARALEEAERALELRQPLARRQQLVIEGLYHKLAHRWPEAVESYEALATFFPDDLSHGLELAEVEVSAGRGAAALETLERLRQLPAPDRDDPRIDLAEADAALSQADYPRQLAAAERAGAKGEELGAGLVVANAELMRGKALVRLGDLDQATAAYARAEEAFATGGDRRGVAEAVRSRAVVLYRRGDVAGSQGLFEQALALYREIGNEGGVAQELNSLGNVLYAQGDLAGAAEKYEASLATKRALGDRPGEAAALTNLANVAYRLGELPRCRTAYERAVALYLEIGNRRNAMAAQSNLANALVLQGELEAARRLQEEALAGARELGDRGAAAAMLGALGSILRTGGDLEGAREKLEEALALRTEIGEETAAEETRLVLAGVTADAGRPEEAEAEARTLIEAFGEAGREVRQGEAWALLARALADQGRAPEARQAAGEARKVLGKTDDLGARLQVVAAVGLAEAAAGSPAAARRLLEPALREAEKAGMLGPALEIRLALGRAQLAQGGTTAARARLEAVEEEARRRGFLLVAEKARASLDASS